MDCDTTSLFPDHLLDASITGGAGEEELGELESTSQAEVLDQCSESHMEVRLDQ